MLFFYRLKILSYALTKVRNLFVKALLLCIYAYTCGVILLFLSSNSSYYVPISSAKYVLYYLYEYVKLCYYNWSNLSYGLVIRLMVALILPYFIYKILANIKWRSFLRRLIIRIIAIIRKRRENNLKNEKGIQNNYKDKVNAIKNILIRDIEKTIDKRLYDIFIAKRDLEHRDLSKKVE